MLPYDGEAGGWVGLWAELGLGLGAGLGLVFSFAAGFLGNSAILRT